MSRPVSVPLSCMGSAQTMPSTSLPSSVTNLMRCPASDVERRPPSFRNRPMPGSSTEVICMPISSAWATRAQVMTPLPHGRVKRLPCASPTTSKPSMSRISESLFCTRPSRPDGPQSGERRSMVSSVISRFIISSVSGYSLDEATREAAHGIAVFEVVGIDKMEATAAAVPACGAGGALGVGVDVALREVAVCFHVEFHDVSVDVAVVRAAEERMAAVATQ